MKKRNKLLKKNMNVAQTESSYQVPITTNLFTQKFYYFQNHSDILFTF